MIINYKKYVHILLSSFSIMYIGIAVKLYVLSNNFWWLVSAFIPFLAILYFYIKIFESGHFTSDYIMVKVLSVALAIPVGYFFFDNKLEIKHYLGLLFALAAIYVLK